MAANSSSIQLISGGGVLLASSLETFMQAVDLPTDRSYAVVAIMGPQSSGKSTLMNNLFSTNFGIMDAKKGRKQTTKGIWMAKAIDVQPLTIVLDIEGNDGKERGEDKKFEREAALFALALADIVLINMWCHDIGRQSDANKLLLSVVFEVMAKYFPPSKTTILFVIRDKTETPLELLESSLMEDVTKIWDEVSKPVHHKDTPLSDFFTIRVTGLCNYAFRRDFNEQVASLKKEFHESIEPHGLAGGREGREPGSAFIFNVKNLWKQITEKKEFDLPAHKVMVATFRCDEISKQKFCDLCKDEGWLKMETAAKSAPVPDFGKKLSAILSTHLVEYDNKAMYFDDGVRERIRAELKSNMLQRVYPTYAALLKHYQRQARESFITELETALGGGKGFASSVRDCLKSCMLQFDQNCADDVPQQATDWNPAQVREKEKLMSDIKAHSASLRMKKLSEILMCCEKNLSDAIEGALIDTILLEGSSTAESWRSIRELVQEETGICISKCNSAVSGFELDDSSCQSLRDDIQKFARDVVKKKVAQEADRVRTHMKDRFVSGFTLDANLMPRSWIVGLDIDRIAQDARLACLKILSAMAVIRLEERPDDNIENLLIESLMNHSTAEPRPLTSNQWNEVAPADTILKPVKCTSLWGQLIDDTTHFIANACIVQKSKEDIEAARAAEERARVDAVRAVERAQAASEEARAEANAASTRALELANAARLEADEVARRSKAAIAAAKAEMLAKAKEVERPTLSTPIAFVFHRIGKGLQWLGI